MRLQPGLVMPGGLVPSLANGGKTYADWVTHVNAQAATNRVWSDAGRIVHNAGLNKTTATTATPSGDMFSTTFASPFFYSATPCRMVQHALPSQTEFNNQRSGGRIILYQVDVAGTADGLYSYTRNGYTSLGETGYGPYDMRAMSEISWWDDALKRPRTCNPYSNATPVDYLKRGWSN